MSNEPQDLQMDAAEYVIGTLSEDERVAFAARLKTDADTRDAVAFWERTLGTLSATISPVAVPESVWARITSGLTTEQPVPAAVSAPAAANTNIETKLRRSRGRWRAATALAAALAVALGLLALNDAVRQEALPVVDRLAGIERSQPDDGQQFVAVVNAGDDQPSLVVSVDAQTRYVTVRSLGIERPSGKSLEVWYVPDGEKAVSVGLVGEGEIDLGALPARDGDLVAISLEPSGGSPTGTATGPVIYKGKLVAVD